jgi:hypothetical protein
MMPSWHDPEFLRYGILAVAAHEEANALTMAPPEMKLSAAGPLVEGLFRLALSLLAPYGLATGLMAVMKQDLWPAVWGFCLLGVGVSAARSKLGEQSTPLTKAPRAEDDLAKHFEYAYKSWSWFRLQRQLGVTGGAAKFHIERMANEGVNVPPVALDLCEALRLRTQSVAAEHPR